MRWFTKSVFHTDLDAELNAFEEQGYDVFSVVFESASSVLVIVRTRSPAPKTAALETAKAKKGKKQ